MTTLDANQLRSALTLPGLLALLRDGLGWQIESLDIEDTTFDYGPAELGIDPTIARSIAEIKQLRPLATHQPWGIFFVRFDAPRLPITALRAMLRGLVKQKRQTASRAERPSWEVEDLLFVCSHREYEESRLTWVHFRQALKAGRAARLITPSSKC